MHRILEHKVTLIIAAAALGLALVAGVRAFWPERRALDTVAAEKRDVSEDVSASGKIDAARHVSLSFGRPGTVQTISVKVGDKVAAGEVLASLDAGDLYASLKAAEADVAIQEANLTSLEKGGRPEQVAIGQQTIQTATLALQTALQDAYLKAADAVRNKIDLLFANGGTANPQYSLRTDSIDAKTAIEQARIRAGEAIDDLAAHNQLGSTVSLDAAASDLAAVRALIDAVTVQTNLLNTANSGLSQDQIDGYTATVNAAASELNIAASSFNNARQGVNTANAQLDLTQASGTPEATVAQEAMVAKAEANVAGIRNQISHALIIAPWDGVVASVAPKEGEAIAANAPAIDLISDGSYTMDIFIPESDIAKVSAGAPATVSIDAAASSTPISALVSSVDLSETMENGVGSYKATVVLDSSSASTTIRTGMAATATIAGRKAMGVLAVPTSALIKRSGGEYVLVGQGGTFVERPVTVGISGGGWTEIASGLSEGELVAAFGGGQ